MPPFNNSLINFLDNNLETRHHTRDIMIVEITVAFLVIGLVYYLMSRVVSPSINFSVQYQYLSQLNLVGKECNMAIKRKAMDIPQAHESFRDVLMDDVWKDIDYQAPDMHYILSHLCLGEPNYDYITLVSDFIESWSDFLESQNRLCLAMTIWLDTKRNISHVTELSLDNQYLLETVDIALKNLENYFVENFGRDDEWADTIQEIRDFAFLA